MIQCVFIRKCRFEPSLTGQKEKQEKKKYIAIRQIKILFKKACEVKFQYFILKQLFICLLSWLKIETVIMMK